MAGRPKSNPPLFTGMSLERWQQADTLIEWARDSAELKLVVEVLFNRFHEAGIVQVPNGERQAGRMGGLAEAILTLQALSQRPIKPPTVPEPDYGTTLQQERERASD